VKGGKENDKKGTGFSEYVKNMERIGDGMENEKDQ